MHFVLIYYLLSFFANLHAISIPSIQNVFLKSISTVDMNISTYVNKTCSQCLCDFFYSKNNTSYIALNCFTNNTCQFFQTFPQTYKLQIFSGAKLYFLQSIFPNSSKCCMPNITELLIRLKNATATIANLLFMPSVFWYDNNLPHEIAIIGRYAGYVYWFDSSDLTFLRSKWIQNASLSFALRNNSILTAIDQPPAINVFNTQTNTSIASVGSSILNKLRKILFINNDQTMIVTSQSNQSLAIFNVNSPTNYTFQQSISFPFLNVHGLTKVNDTFLYASSWTDRSIVSYSYQNSTWTYQAFSNNTGSGSGSHLIVDDCGRVWLIINSFGIRIYDSSGIEIGNWNMANSSRTIYDLLFLPNYVLLVTRKEDQQIYRYDPQVVCS